MRKQVITIQIDPMVLAEARSWAKEEGLPKQVAIETLIKEGLTTIMINRITHNNQ